LFSPQHEVNQAFEIRVEKDWLLLCGKLFAGKPFPDLFAQLRRKSTSTTHLFLEESSVSEWQRRDKRQQAGVGHGGSTTAAVA
jgi:hypothetical protein